MACPGRASSFLGALLSRPRDPLCSQVDASPTRLHCPLACPSLAKQSLDSSSQSTRPLRRTLKRLVWIHLQMRVCAIEYPSHGIIRGKRGDKGGIERYRGGEGPSRPKGVCKSEEKCERKSVHPTEPKSRRLGEHHQSHRDKTEGDHGVEASLVDRSRSAGGSRGGLGRRGIGSGGGGSSIYGRSGRGSSNGRGGSRAGSGGGRR